ncbi:unnamed protein product, partial [Prorocentrum cordatum]
GRVRAARAAPGLEAAIATARRAGRPRSGSVGNPPCGDLPLAVPHPRPEIARGPRLACAAGTAMTAGGSTQEADAPGSERRVAVFLALTLLPVAYYMQETG